MDFSSALHSFSPQPTTRVIVFCFLILLTVTTACGVKGPPLPPIVISPQQSEALARKEALNTGIYVDGDDVELFNEEEYLPPSDPKVLKKPAGQENVKNTKNSKVPKNLRDEEDTFQEENYPDDAESRSFSDSIENNQPGALKSGTPVKPNASLRDRNIGE